MLLFSVFCAYTCILCPLSPLLFILTLEPFIRMIKLNDAVRGFTVRDREFKLAAYADDLLFFLTNPTISIPNLVREFSHYGYLSNLKINYTKSEALNISLSDNLLALTKSNSNFRWDSRAIKYLGTWLTLQIQSIYEHNFPRLLNCCSTDITNWQTKHFSWFGRAEIIKMVILPKILNLMRTLPIKIPPHFFKTLNSTLLKFL